MQESNMKIVRVTEENYSRYEDMVFWRVKGRERKPGEDALVPNQERLRSQQELSFNGFYVYAAELDGKFVGWIHLLYMPKISVWKKGILYVDELWTQPDYRRKGIGLALMEQAKRLHRELGTDHLRLYTDNPAAIALYERVGFKNDGDCIFMQCQD